MACGNIIGNFGFEKGHYIQLESTLWKSDLNFLSLLIMFMYGSLLIKSLSSSISVLVRTISSLYFKFKVKILRAVFAADVAFLVSCMSSMWCEIFVLEVLVFEFDYNRCDLDIIVYREKRLGSLSALCFNKHSVLDFFIHILSSGLIYVDNALLLAIVLSIVFQCLVGYVDKGSTKTYNPGSLEFRATYVSLLLFLGAYVWIKFREVARRTVRRIPKKDKFGKVLKDEFGQVQYYDKWEPRFTPPREEGFGKHNRLSLGGYDTHSDSEVVCQIARFYYGKDEGAVALVDGSHFPIPEMSEQERSLCGEEKRKWVSAKAKEVFREFKERASLSANAGEQVDARGFSPPADQAVVAFSTARDYESAEFLLASGLTHEHHGPTMQLYTDDLFNPDDLFNIEAGLALSQEASAPAMQESWNVQLNPQRDQLGDPTMQFNPEDLLNSDADLALSPEELAPAMQETLNEQLNLQREQIEAEFNRRLAEHHRCLEEENSELRQENKRLKTMLQQAATPLRAFFVTSTVELETSTENC